MAQTYLAAIDDEAVHSNGDTSDEEHSPPTKRRRIVEIPAAPQHTAAAKHLPEMTEMKNSMRCRMHGCSAKSKVRCVACNIFLCMTADRNCFLKFHT